MGPPPPVEGPGGLLHYDFADFDDQTCRLERIANISGAKVSRMLLERTCNRWLGFLDTYRTLCAALGPDLRRFLDAYRQLSAA